MIDGLGILDGPTAYALSVVIFCLLLTLLLYIRQRRKRNQFFRPVFTL
jgi:hypothetical protein